MNARGTALVAVLLAALAAAPAEASRKLSVATLEVPATTQAGEPLAISGTVTNSGDEPARATVRAYIRESLGQLRLGGRRLAVGADQDEPFALAPEVPEGVAAGSYAIVVCAQRLNKRGGERCRSAPLTVEG